MLSLTRILMVTTLHKPKPVSSILEVITDMQEAYNAEVDLELDSQSLSNDKSLMQPPRYLEALPFATIPHSSSQYRVLHMSNRVIYFRNPSEAKKK